MNTGKLDDLIQPASYHMEMEDGINGTYKINNDVNEHIKVIASPLTIKIQHLQMLYAKAVGPEKIDSVMVKAGCDAEKAASMLFKMTQENSQSRSRKRTKILGRTMKSIKSGIPNLMESFSFNGENTEKYNESSTESDSPTAPTYQGKEEKIKHTNSKNSMFEFPSFYKLSSHNQKVKSRKDKNDFYSIDVEHSTYDQNGQNPLSA